MIEISRGISFEKWARKINRCFGIVCYIKSGRYAAELTLRGLFEQESVFYRRYSVWKYNYVDCKLIISENMVRVVCSRRKNIKECESRGNISTSLSISEGDGVKLHYNEL